MEEIKTEIQSIKVRGKKIYPQQDNNNPRFVFEVSCEDAAKIEDFKMERGLSSIEYDVEISILKERKEGEDLMKSDEKKYIFKKNISGICNFLW